MTDFSVDKSPIENKLLGNKFFSASGSSKKIINSYNVDNFKSLDNPWVSKNYLEKHTLDL